MGSFFLIIAQTPKNRKRLSVFRRTLYNQNMKRLELTITSEYAGVRIDQVLRRHWHMASGFVSSLKFRENAILLNGEAVRSNALCKLGDVLSVDISDRSGGNEAEPMACPLRFVYEDEYLAVLDKPHGMAVHGSLQGGDCTVANALAALWGREQSFHPVNRLDKGTGGLMVIAKCGYVHDRLRHALHSEDFVREYEALCEGGVRSQHGRITLPIGKAEGTRRCIDLRGESADTEYWLLERRENISHLRLRLRTGRTHQIRVHLAALGCPICGDRLYGAELPYEEPGFALKSVYLRFTHPISGETVEIGRDTKLR